MCSAFSLTDLQYQRAVAGLTFAMASPWELDLRGHEYQQTDALRRAILGSTNLQSLNKLTVHGGEGANLSSSVQRDRRAAQISPFNGQNPYG